MRRALAWVQLGKSKIVSQITAENIFTRLQIFPSAGLAIHHLFEAQ